MTVRTSNQVLFDVTEQNTASNVGWELFVYDRDSPTTLLTILPRFKGFSFQKVLSDTGAGSILLDMNDPTFQSADIQTHVINDENIIRFVKNGVVRFALLAHDEVESPVTEQEDKPATVTGRGAAALLEWATVLPPAYPVFTALPWTWTNTPALSAWLDLKTAADARGCVCASIVPTFTETNDSQGSPWGDINNMELKPGGDLLSLLRRFSEAGSADWVVEPNTLSLKCAPNLGYDRSSTVRFFVGRNVLQAEKVRTRRAIANVVYTISANEQVPFVQDPVSLAQWGRREVLAEVGNAQDSTTAQSFGQIILDANKEEVLTATFQVDPNTPGRVVFEDYDVGDWVWLDSDDLGLEGSYRILAIGYEVSEDGAERAELTVESQLEVRLVQLQKQFERETGSTMRLNSELQIGNTATGGAGAGGLNEWSKSNVDLGTLAPLPGYTWGTITGVPKRAMVWRLTITSGGSLNWSFQITSRPNGGGDLMFEAVGIGDTEYVCSWPWVYKNTDDPQSAQMYIGVRNIAGATSQFTLAEMRGETLSQ